jgi:fumarate reductase subunit D
MTRWKRSHAPIFWALFGGGGTLSSLVGPALILITGVLVPIGLMGGVMSHDHVLAFARSLVGKAFLFAVIMLFAWHAVHRIYKSLHDIGIHPGPLPAACCYGTAAVITVIAGWSLLRIGF